MKTFDVRFVFAVFAIAAAALITGCGGNAAPEPADQHPTNATLMVPVNAPVADCEAEGCNRPRIVDGLAEQYRADAIARPAEPVQAAEPLPAVMASQDSPSAAAPGLAGQPQ